MKNDNVIPLPTGTTRRNLIHIKSIVRAADETARAYGIGFTPKIYGDSTLFHLLSDIFAAQEPGVELCDIKALLKFLNGHRTGVKENPGLSMFVEHCEKYAQPYKVDKEGNARVDTDGK